MRKGDVTTTRMRRVLEGGGYKYFFAGLAELKGILGGLIVGLTGGFKQISSSGDSAQGAPRRS